MPKHNKFVYRIAMIDKQEIILLSVSGQDRPGLTASLTKVLANYKANILDIGQADIHDTLSLGILFEIESGKDSAPVLKDLLFTAYELNITVKFTPISLSQYEQWVGQQGKNRYILTLLGKNLNAHQISAITKIVSDQYLNIDAIKRLTGRRSLQKEFSQDKSCIQLSVRGNILNKAVMNEAIMKVSTVENIDVAFQEDNIYRRNRRLVCFDMDSTLIQTEVIDELAIKAGVGEQVMAITEEAMQGKLDFKESFVRRMALLEGLEADVLQEIAENLPLTEGAERLFKALKTYGFSTAILSGGFTYFGNYLKKKLDIDHVFANQLEIVDGKLTGRHLGEIVDGERKATLLEELAQTKGLNLEQVIAVGDGANDLPMLNKAGLGIAFHAKPLVKQNAQNALSYIGLDGLLYLLGYHDRQIDLNLNF